MPDITSIILLLCALGAALWALCWGWKAFRLTSNAPLVLTPENLEDNYFSLDTASEVDLAETPKLSVIVYVTDLTDNLEDKIKRLTLQRTLWPYEIIMVCNASARETAALTEKYAAFRGVRFTFIPPEAKNLSRRKLAFTVGIKSARGEAVLLTASNMNPSSAGWFQLMGEDILNNPEIDMALGTTRFNFYGMKGFRKYYRSFLWVTDKCQAIGSAIAGHAYRGDWGNMAMRRSFFFDCKGYGATLDLETGDDDLFIARGATPDNTIAVVAPVAMPEAEWGDWTDRVWTEQRAAYDFTSRLLPHHPFMMKGALSFCNWMMAILTLAIIGFSVAEILLTRQPAGECSFFRNPTDALVFWIPSMVAVLMWMCFQGLQILFYSKGASRLMAPKPLLMIPLYFLWRPFGNIFFRQTHSIALDSIYINRRRA